MPRLLPLLLLAACANENDLGRVNAPPAVEIVAPAPGDVIREGDTVTAGALATDDVDALLAVQWTLDGAPVEGELANEGEGTGDGLVQSGYVATLGQLARGEYALAIEVVDADGEVATDAIVFEVHGPAGAPSVEITQPAEGTSFEAGEQVAFAGSATDTTTEPGDLDFAWTSSLDGDLAGAVSGDGASLLLASALSVGTHVVTLSATDTDGEVGTDTVGVVVSEAPPPEPEPGDLIFTEFMVNPDVVDDEYGEWVELYNTAGYAIDVAGYSFHDDDSDDWTFEDSIVVEPGDYVVLCAHADPAQNGGVPCDGWFYRSPMGEKPPTGSGGGVAIANSADELVLTSPTGVDLDRFAYTDDDSEVIEGGRSLGLDPGRLDGVENDDMGNWCPQQTVLPGISEPGTPGEANDPC